MRRQSILSAYYFSATSASVGGKGLARSCEVIAVCNTHLMSFCLVESVPREDDQQCPYIHCQTSKKASSLLTRLNC